jgi:hypothetical protein
MVCFIEFAPIFLQVSNPSFYVPKPTNDFEIDYLNRA